MSPASTARRGAVLLLGVGVLLVAALVFLDEPGPEAADYSAVRAPSALDTWTAPWQPEEPTTEARLPERWIVVGWDGADWDLVLPLVEEGRLPNLADLMRRGTSATLHSMIPTVSPAIWTTVATGVSPARHGITHFYNQQPRWERLWNRVRHFGKLQRRLFTNADRRSKAIWNELSERGFSSLVVGYHNTFPVEEIDGMMVSNYLVQDSVGDVMSMDSGEGRDSLATGLVHPRENLTSVLEIQERVNRGVVDAVGRFARLDEAEIVDFVRQSRRLEPGGDEKPYFLVRAWAFDTIVAEVADTFIDDVDANLVMVHFQGVDWASHRFYYYQDPEAFADFDIASPDRARLDAERERYSGTVAAFYEYLDEWLGRLLAHRDETTAVVVMSDHGFEPAPDPDLTGEHDSAPAGILVVEGPGICPGRLEASPSIYDVLPTLMAGLQLPVADDLPGAPLADAFCPEAWGSARHETIPSYGAGDFVPSIPRPDDLDDDVLRQLESLGYLD